MPDCPHALPSPFPICRFSHAPPAKSLLPRRVKAADRAQFLLPTALPACHFTPTLSHVSTLMSRHPTRQPDCPPAVASSGVFPCVWRCNCVFFSLGRGTSESRNSTHGQAVWMVLVLCHVTEGGCTLIRSICGAVQGSGCRSRAFVGGQRQAHVACTAGPSRGAQSEGKRLRNQMQRAAATKRGAGENTGLQGRASGRGSQQRPRTVRQQVGCITVAGGGAGAKWGWAKRANRHHSAGLSALGASRAGAAPTGTQQQPGR